MAEIPLKSITKRFANLVAVDVLNPKIHDRQFVALLGESE